MMIRRSASVLLMVILWSVFMSVQGWEWFDRINGEASSSKYPQTLTLEEIQLMRVRDIKRLLSRSHGYSADELARILDKKELISALAYEEEKVRSAYHATLRRSLTKQGIIFSVLAVLVVLCWPLIYQAYEIASVNLVVYYDRKKYEASRCWEVKSIAALVGVIVMLILDLLQIWLSISIPLSWVLSRNHAKYLFPTPSFPVRPGQFMGPEIAQSPVGNYGINVGPMVIGWAIRFFYGYLEHWTGKALANSQRAHRQAMRAAETPEEKAARRAARKAAKDASREAERLRSYNVAMQTESSSTWIEPVTETANPSGPIPFTPPNINENMPPPRESKAHIDFMAEIDQYANPDSNDPPASELEELD